MGRLVILSINLIFKQTLSTNQLIYTNLPKPNHAYCTSVVATSGDPIGYRMMIDSSGLHFDGGSPPPVNVWVNGILLYFSES